MLFHLSGFWCETRKFLSSSPLLLRPSFLLHNHKWFAGFFYILCLAGPLLWQLWVEKEWKKLTFLRGRMFFLADGAGTSSYAHSGASRDTMLWFLSPQSDFLQSHYQQSALFKYCRFAQRQTLPPNDLVLRSNEIPKGNITCLCPWVCDVWFWVSADIESQSGTLAEESGRSFTVFLSTRYLQKLISHVLIIIFILLNLNLVSW